MTAESGEPDFLYEDILPGGTHWSMLMRQGTRLQMVDIEGGANVGMLLYNPADKLERYNAPDTLKCQHTFKLTRGHCLYSDMGRIFCSIIEDSIGWHDTVSGYLDEKTLHSRWGKRSYQQFRNDWTLSGEHSFLVELAKHGLGRRDLSANLNWFSRVAADNEGHLRFDPANSPAGSSVCLRFEMDTLVILHTCPHPLNTAPDYPKRPIRYRIGRAAEVSKEDYCLNWCPENRRGFENNKLYHLCGSHHDH